LEHGERIDDNDHRGGQNEDKEAMKMSYKLIALHEATHYCKNTLVNNCMKKYMS